MTKVRLKALMTKTSKLSICVAASCYLATGCSLINSDTKSEAQNELERSLDQYSSLETELQRVLALESDMQMIIAELGKSSNLGAEPLSDNVQVDGLSPISGKRDSMQPKQVSDVDETHLVNGSNENVIQTNPCRGNRAANSAHCSQQVGINIAAFRESEHVFPGWQYLKSRLPNKLKNKRPLRSTIYIESQTYYRLLLGPFTSTLQAKKACDRVLEKMKSCSITEYRGSRIGF